MPDWWNSPAMWGVIAVGACIGAIGSAAGLALTLFADRLLEDWRQYRHMKATKDTPRGRVAEDGDCLERKHR